MSNSSDRELKIIIKADGSVAIDEINRLGKGIDAAGEKTAKSGKQTVELWRQLEKTGNVSGAAAPKFETLGGAVANAGKKAGEAERSFGVLGDATNSLGEKIKSLRADWADATLGINQSLELLEKGKQYIQSGWDLAEQGAQFRAAQDSFEAYARSVGVNSEEILSSLRKASGGTIDDMNLIKTASLAMSLGVTQDAAKMGTLLEVARNKARLFGVSTQQAFEDIVTGIGRASPKILDNLGIRIPATFEKMTDGMSDADKVAKLFEMTLEEGGAQLKAMGGTADTAHDSMQRLSASYENLKATGGAFLLDALRPGVDWLNSAVERTEKFIGASNDLNGEFRDLVDTVEIVIGTFAGWKVASIAANVATLAKQTNFVVVATNTLTEAQLLLNVAMSAHPALLLAAGLAALGTHLYQISSETERWNKYTEEQLKLMESAYGEEQLGRLERMSEKGAKTAASLRALTKSFRESFRDGQIAMKEATLAALGNIDEIDKRIAEIERQAETRRQRENKSVYRQLVQGRDDPGTFIGIANAQDNYELNALVAKKQEIIKVQKEIAELRKPVVTVPPPKPPANKPPADKPGPTDEELEAARKAAEEEAKRIKERQKNLNQALVAEANEAWRQLFEGVENAALAPLDRIVVEYEKEGRKAIDALLGGLAMSTVGTDPIKGLDLAEYWDKDFAEFLDKDFKKVVTGAQEMEQAIQVSSDRAVDHLLAMTTALSGLHAPRDSQGFFTFLDGIVDRMDSIPTLFDRIKTASAAQQVADYEKQRILSDPGIETVLKSKKTKDNLSKTIAEAVSTGFANADFSNFTLTFGSILSSVVSKSMANKFPVIGEKGAVNWGNLGVNIAANAAISFLTSPGGLFGGRKQNGTEAIEKSTDLKTNLTNAYLQSYVAGLQPYLNDISGTAAKIALAEARRIEKVTVGTGYNDSGNGITSKLTRTYYLIDNGASAALEALNKAIDAANDYNREVERSIEVLVASGQDFAALQQQTLAYQAAAQAAQQAAESQTLNWTDGSTSSIDLSESIHELVVTSEQLLRQLGSATAERTSIVDQGFTNYAPWLDTIPIQLAVALDGLRANILENPPIGGREIGTERIPIPAFYDAFSELQTSFLDREIAPYLIDMVEQAGTNRFELDALKLTDEDAYQQEYMTALDRQLEIFEEVMRRQKEIFADETKTYEERAAALEDYEQSLETYHQTKLQKLQREKQIEEEEKRLMAEQSMAKIEAGLSLVGELSQRGDKITIIQAGDAQAAINEMMTKFADDPNVVALLQKILDEAAAKAQWG